MILINYFFYKKNKVIRCLLFGFCSIFVMPDEIRIHIHISNVVLTTVTRKERKKEEKKKQTAR